MARKIKFTLPILSNERIEELFKMDVLSDTDFKSHVQEVSNKLKVDPSIVEDVLVNYFKGNLKQMNTDHKVKAIFSIFGYLNIKMERTNNFYKPKIKWNK